MGAAAQVQDLRIWVLRFSLLKVKNLNFLDEMAAKANSQNKLLWVHLHAAAWNESSRRWREDVYLNENLACFRDKEYLSIELDRDEWSDLDLSAQIMMQSLTSQGGWPLNFFITWHKNQSVLVFGAGALEKEALIECVRDLRVAFELDRKGVIEMGLQNQKLAAKLNPLNAAQDFASAQATPLAELRATAVAEPRADGARSLQAVAQESLALWRNPTLQSVDFATGLIGRDQHFLNPSLYSCLTLWGSSAASPNLGEVALAKLARTRLYDCIGGGFFRSLNSATQSVESEKLLIENAEMFEVLAECAAKTRSPYVTQLASETLRCLMDDFWIEQRSDFARALGASNSYYALSPSDLLEALTGSERLLAQRFFGVSSSQPAIPRVAETVAELAESLGIAPVDVQNQVASLQKKLLAHRKHRAGLGGRLGPSLCQSSVEPSGRALAAIVRGLVLQPALVSTDLVSKLKRLLKKFEALETADSWAFVDLWSAVSRCGALAVNFPSAKVLALKLARALTAEEGLDLTEGVGGAALRVVRNLCGARYDLTDHLGLSNEGLKLRAWLSLECLSTSSQEPWSQHFASALLVSRRIGIAASAMHRLALEWQGTVSPQSSFAGSAPLQWRSLLQVDPA